MRRKLLHLFGAVLCVMLFTGCRETGPQKGGDDMRKYPFYDADYANAAYGYTAERLYQPYFKGNIIYNELVLLVDDGAEISGNLLYEPLRIIAVKDNTLKTDYSPDTDYRVEGNKIVRREGSAAPYLTEANLRGEGIGEPFNRVDTLPFGDILTDYVVWGDVVYTESPLFYGHYLSVTYAVDVKSYPKDVFKAYDEINLSGVIDKLYAKQDIKTVVIGDSISEGCSSSETFNHEPYTPPYGKLVKAGLAARYGVNVDLVNLSKGGEMSAYGAAQARIDAINAENPDLVIIGFGMNDGNSTAPRISAQAFCDNLETMIKKVKAANPDCSFILLHTYPPNPGFGNAYSVFDGYMAKLTELAARENACVVDMFKVGRHMLEQKRYAEISANGVNHPNDFFTRVYAMNILSALIDY
ncbi:hypothetical protein FACS1894211_15610 [Clostridia bacterium]|nr:hypothetical protein FACS1894211_15610 [Clostridia bacterium]